MKISRVIKDKKLKFLVFFCFLIIFQASFFYFSYSTPLLISVSAGMVGDKVVTSREVHVHYIMEEVLFKKLKKVPKKIDIKSKTFLLKVDSLLLEEALYLESKIFFKQDVSRQEINQSLKRLKQKVENSSYWKFQGVSQSELRSILKRKLSVKRFMQFRIESSLTLVTDEEAREYYNQNKKKFGRTSFERVKRSIKSYISQGILNQRLQEWFRILEKKYKVQNLLHEI